MLNGIKIALLVAGLASAGAAYILLRQNISLRAEVIAAEAKVEVQKEARVKDAKAAHQLIEATAAEQARLQQQLITLEGIRDEDGRKYLDTVVPNSVGRLFNN